MDPQRQRALHLAAKSQRRQRDGGYLLLAILLMMALMIIAATIVAPRVVQQIKRDREEEMIHRGTEYARAIKKYYKKFGRYPTSLEQLEKTNEIRFLRKRYKDPLTKDGKWALLHYGDIQTLLNANAPGTPIAGTGLVTPGGGVIQGVPSPGVNSQFAKAQAIDGSGAPVFGQNAGAGSNPTGIVAGNPALSGSTDNGGGNVVANPTFSDSTDNSGGAPAGGAAAQPGSSFGSNFNQNPNSNQPGSAQPGNSIFGQNAAGGNQTFGAGAIVGVASTNKEQTIRIYNKKKKYNEWQFIYNPMDDRANVLLRGPYQPTTIGGAQVGTPAGQLNQQQQNGFGQPQNSFGQPQNSFGQPQNNFGQQQNGFGQQPQSLPNNNFPPDQNQSPH